MTRVLGLVTEAYGGRGGIAQATRDIVGAIAASIKDVQIDLLVRLTPDPVANVPAGVWQAPPIEARLGYAFRAIAASRRKPDIVYCNHLYMAPLARLVSRLAGARLVIHLHGIEVWGAFRSGCRDALESADLVLCVSRDTRRRVLTKVALAPERTVVLNNTVEDRFQPGDRKLARAKFGLDDSTVLLTVGRLSSHEKYKGHDRVIAALPRLQASGPRAMTYIVAGDGDDRTRLEHLAQKTGVASSVRFLGFVENSDLPDLYRAADLFVMPSEGEGFGIAFLEAMSCGTRAVGLAAGGAPDALGDGELGLCVTAEAFDEALVRELMAPCQETSPLEMRVRARFGRDTFNAQAAAALTRLTSPPILKETF